VIGEILAQAGADPAQFPDYTAGPGTAELDGICRAAEAIGVFGVPSFVLNGELFWGREHLPDIREMLGVTV
jgi:2-hydroxychromene-2-carboxylate isomerase